MFQDFFGCPRFDRNIFGFSRFRAKNFYNFQLSIQIFLGFFTFEPKKNPGISGFGSFGPGRSTTRMPVSSLTDTFFSNFRADFFYHFQLSIQNFLGFSTFAPTFFSFFNFQTKKNSAAGISDRTCRVRSVVRSDLPAHGLRR